MRLASFCRRTAVVSLAMPALLAALVATAYAEGGTRVRFVVTGLESTDGRVLCGLYKDQSKWLTPKYFKGAQGKPRPDGKAVCVFENVQPGVYAISAFHDEDDDQELDSGVFSIPKEDYCASNNAYRRFGPPQWEDATFRVGREAVRMSAPVH
jgi:uncharacterized protein (DUF2141 family)